MLSPYISVGQHGAMVLHSCVWTAPIWSASMLLGVVSSCHGIAAQRQMAFSMCVLVASLRLG
jgi:hypothetical protein